MPFWTSQQLEQKAPDLIKPYLASSIDCNSYALHMGDEYFCTADQSQESGRAPTIQKLTGGQGFSIPPGQFAFLLTQEIVSVPRDAMAFISVKSGMKFHGLVNVSGFHIDPGYEGRLVFSVHNAGPSPLSLKQGMPLFVIWYASLAEESKIFFEPDKAHFEITPKMIQGMSREVLSLQSLSSEIEKVKINMAVQTSIFRWAITLASGVFAATLVGVLLLLLRVYTFVPDSPPNKEISNEVEIHSETEPPLQSIDPNANEEKPESGANQGSQD